MGAAQVAAPTPRARGRVTVIARQHRGNPRYILRWCPGTSFAGASFQAGPPPAGFPCFYIDRRRKIAQLQQGPPGPGVLLLIEMRVDCSDDSSQILWEDGERVFRRGWQPDDSGNRRAVLIVLPAAGHPSRTGLDRLTHEYKLKDELDGAWAARPLELVRDECCSEGRQADPGKFMIPLGTPVE